MLGKPGHAERCRALPGMLADELGKDLLRLMLEPPEFGPLLFSLDLRLLHSRCVTVVRYDAL